MKTILYNKEYYLSDCEGFSQFQKSQGKVLSPRLKKVFRLAELKPGMKLLDIGFGRGELILQAAKAGTVAFGIEYSEDALKITDEAMKQWTRKNPEINGNCFPLKSNAALLPFKNKVFDVIILSDIIEHLFNDELLNCFKECFRVLKPGGRLVLHTTPNRLFMSVGLRLYQALGLLFGRWIGLNPRERLPAGLKKNVHVNEQTLFSLKRLLKKSGFKNPDLWLEKSPQYIYYFLKDDIFVKRVRWFYFLLPVKHFFFSDIFGRVRKEN